jgi:two-component system NtrC family sensor kinase
MTMVDSRSSQSEKVALRERIKELTCLYDIAQIASQSNKSLENILQGIVKVLPSAWQYPETTLARLVLYGVSYTTSDFPTNCQKQSADVFVNGKPRGFIEIGYAEQKPDLDEGPFLKEERSLLNEIARQVALIIERKQAEEDKVKLHDQLRHADRLATVGMIAAGVAHELNEPLGNILGFAQLAKKCSEVPVSVKQDIEKIEKASLHAREIIQKLLVFARQVPPEKRQVNLNKVIKDGLYFFNARCSKEGIELICNLCQNLPKIVADPVQLNQVLVNLVVNALQSISGAGRITVQTQFYDHNVYLVVEDTGPGMNKEVLDKIFVPFFTTKDIGHGTGLGLPVVHGIVTAHGGTIKVESKVGRGTRFEIQLPIREEQDIKETN